MTHTLAAAVPSADIFDTADKFFGNLQTVLIGAFAAIILIVLLKQFVKAPTVMAGILGVITAIFVGWLVTQYGNDDVNQILDDTVSELGAPPATDGDLSQTPEGAARITLTPSALS